MERSKSENEQSEHASDFSLEKIVANTRAELDHYMGNKIGTILMILEMNAKETGDCANLLRGFIDGLRRTLKKLDESSIEESKGVTREVIEEFIHDAEHISDPENQKAIQELYDKYALIRGLKR